MPRITSPASQWVTTPYGDAKVARVGEDVIILFRGPNAEEGAKWLISHVGYDRRDYIREDFQLVKSPTTGISF